jgi:hypothetical protein
VTAENMDRLIREALEYAILKRTAEEKQMDYVSPSCQLAAWRDVLKAFGGAVPR